MILLLKWFHKLFYNILQFNFKKKSLKCHYDGQTSGDGGESYIVRAGKYVNILWNFRKNKYLMQQTNWTRCKEQSLSTRTKSFWFSAKVSNLSHRLSQMSETKDPLVSGLWQPSQNSDDQMAHQPPIKQSTMKILVSDLAQERSAMSGNISDAHVLKYQ